MQQLHTPMVLPGSISERPLVRQSSDKEEKRMSEEKMTASLSIDAKYVEEEVSRIVKAAIVSALGNRDEIIRKAIDRTIDTYVDRD